MGPNTSPTPFWTLMHRAAVRHKGAAALILLLGIASGIVCNLATSRVYRSEGALLVRLGRENAMLDPTATAGGDRVVAVPMTREDEINSVVEVLKSRAIAEKVVDDLGPDVILARAAEQRRGEDCAPDLRGSDASEWIAATCESVRQTLSDGKEMLRQFTAAPSLDRRDQAVLACLRNFSVRAVRRSNVIDVSYDSQSPRLSQDVTARFIDVFLDEHVRIHRAAGSHDFFAEQAAKLRGDLDRREEQLRDLKNETGLAWPEEQRRLLVTRISAMDADVSQAEAARAASQAKVDALREKLRSLPATEVASEETGYGNEGTDDMRGQLYAILVEEHEAAARYTDAYPKMQELRRRSDEARKLLAAEEQSRKRVSVAPSQAYQDTRRALLAEEPALVAMQAQATALRAQLVDVRRSLAQLNENELRIARMQRDIALDEVNYRKYATSLEQSRIDAALEDQRMSNISIVQPASYEPKPISPRTTVNLGLGLLGGLCGGVGLALALEYRARSFRSPDDIERELSLPALATIPRFTREQLAVVMRRGVHD